ncbi:ficolin-2-like [Drosophila busckii]|uniref:ficolin-2-like n=1 Tax=Drosophila busckii TaxID=30019 RepID=UPI00143331E9|nr:ficolin-2-like [Drosophila busckii]
MNNICYLLGALAFIVARAQSLPRLEMNESSLTKGFYPSSCPQWEGLYTIQVPGAKPFKALCDSTLAGDGWLIIARRFDGSVNFYRNWTMYKEGFGDLSSEFFIGLENLHAITASQAHELYVYLEDFDGNKRYANYDGFVISSEIDSYKLQILGAYSGDAGDGLRFHVDGKFATFDKFNSIDYAVDYRGGWWYNKGWKSNLFGAYMSGEFNSAHGYCGMAWSFWRGFYYSYKNIQMMVRPKCNRLQD